MSGSSEIKNSEDPSQIAVTASKSVEKMSDTELFETLGAMSQTRLEADNLSAFQADLLKLTAEMLNLLGCSKDNFIKLIKSLQYIRGLF